MEFYKFCTGKVGIDQDKFWDRTLLANSLSCEAFAHHQTLEWERIRKLEFIILSSTIVGGAMGKAVHPYKSIKKPTDLYTLPTDLAKKKIIIDKDRAEQAIEKSRKHLEELWHKKKD